MIYTVSTVKDSLANVTRFVEGNVRAGADLMFVFSEDPDDEVSQYLSAHEFVIHVPATQDGGHWHGNRPENIYARQNINANLVRTLLSSFPWATWLFHIDGDEILDIDRDELEGLPDDVRVVQLEPLEAVAAVDSGWEDVFKFPLSAENLALLYTLGAISEPDLSALYNGHTIGKPGIRPSLDYWIGIHRTKVGEEAIAPHRSAGLQVLHYDSYNRDEFVRKWMAKVTNTGANQRGRRRVVRNATVAAIRLGHLSDERRAQILAQIFESHVADDVDLLSELGFLTRPHESRHQYSPRPHTADQLSAMREALVLLEDENPRVFSPMRGIDAQREALERAQARAKDAGRGPGWNPWNRRRATTTRRA